MSLGPENPGRAMHPVMLGVICLSGSALMLSIFKVAALALSAISGGVQ